MKKIVLIINSILLALVIASLVFVFTKKSNNEDNGTIINKEKIQTIINDKNDEIIKITKETVKQIKENEDSLAQTIPMTIAGNEDKINELEKKNIGIFIYEDNILKFWTNNNFPLPSSATNNFFENDLINLNNGWYLCYYESINNYLVVTLFQIKKEYSYENDNLDYNYQKEFHLSKEISFTTDPQENSVEISTKNKNEKFYLSLPQKTLLITNEISLRDILIIINVIIGFYLIFSFFQLFIKKQQKHRFLYFLIFFIIINILRFLMINYDSFYSLKYIEFFSPTLFAQSTINSSLADLLLNSLITFTLSILFFKNFKSSKIRSPKNSTEKIIISILLSFFMLILAKLLATIFFGLVTNSSISFELYYILNLDIYSVTGILILIIIVFSTTIILFTMIKILREYLKLPVILICLFLGFASGQIYNFEKLSLISTCLFNLLFFIYFSYLSFIFIKEKQKFIYKILYMIIISLLISLNLSYLMNIRNNEKNRLLLNNLADESDILTEYFLLKVEEDLEVDDNFKKNVIEGNEQELNKIITQNIRSNRYFNSYDFTITFCNPDDSVLLYNDSIIDCFSYFYSFMNENAHRVNNSNFYLINSIYGKSSYLAEISSLVDENISHKIFLDIYKKSFSEGIGYPELLIDNKYVVENDLKDYNCLRYKDNVLISSSNVFQYDYSTELQEEGNDTNRYSVYKKNGLINYKFKVNKSDTVVLVKPYNQFFNDIISFIYIFILLFIIFQIFQLVNIIILRKEQQLFTFSNKIHFTFGLSMLLSLLVLGSISISFINQAYTQKQRTVLKTKLNSIIIDLNSRLEDTKNINDVNSKEISNLLITLSNIYFIDINIFDTDGILYSSSRPEFFDKGLKGRYMNPLAKKALTTDKKGYTIFSDKIDNLSFVSAYIPYRNRDNQVIAYLNLPYFMQKSEYVSEITNFITTYTNIFFFLMIISIIIGLIISRQISKPLISIQNNIRSMKLNVKSEKIAYNGKDEIGSLIDVYNRKVDELNLFAQKLAQSERESAWREMAKQIAHEIKNPLTPMKLNLQFLLRSYDPDSEIWKNNFIKMANNIIAQIDSLSNIASEFSNFAKIAEAKKETCDLKNIIQSSLDLFSNNYEHISFNFNHNVNSNYLIFVDREQMQRVFNNIIKNAIQAIPDEREGKIIINIEEENDNYIVDIIDNGTGIPEEIESKIFSPNFTTKSSGMGLGLSIVKTIILNNNASIKFNTEPDKGTTFIIEIPKIKTE